MAAEKMRAKENSFSLSFFHFPNSLLTHSFSQYFLFPTNEYSVGVSLIFETLNPFKFIATQKMRGKKKSSLLHTSFLPPPSSPKTPLLPLLRLNYSNETNKYLVLLQKGSGSSAGFQAKLLKHLVWAP